MMTKKFGMGSGRRRVFGAANARKLMNRVLRWLYGASRGRAHDAAFHLGAWKVSVLFGLLITNHNVLAISYGIYDSRAAGMGGAVVAAGNSENAIFYNPALLSFHDEKEDESRDGRFFFPMIAGQYYEEPFDDLDAVADLNIDEQLEAAVAAFK